MRKGWRADDGKGLGRSVRPQLAPETLPALRAGGASNKTMKLTVACGACSLSPHVRGR